MPLVAGWAPTLGARPATATARSQSSGDRLMLTPRSTGARPGTAKVTVVAPFFGSR
jgi:hypothetical protein